MKWKREQLIVFSNSEEDDAEPVKTWQWFVRFDSIDSADARSSKEPYPLPRHLEDAKQIAEQLVKRLKMKEPLRTAIIVAAKYHDLGKRRKIWQKNIGNFDESVAWAKSGKRIALIERSRYRHEFGSLLDIESEDDFKSLSAEMRELVLHLIAAHHGRARPYFPAEESFDHEPNGRDVGQTIIEVPRRFARLQRKYGRWGLAYLESLVRAADIAASKLAEQKEPS